MITRILCVFAMFCALVACDDDDGNGAGGTGGEADASGGGGGEAGEGGAGGEAGMGGEDAGVDAGLCETFALEHTQLLNAPTDATVIRKVPTHPPVPDGLP